VSLFTSNPCRCRRRRRCGVTPTPHTPKVTSEAIAAPGTLTMGTSTAPILGGVAQFRNLKVGRERERARAREREREREGERESERASSLTCEIGSNVCHLKGGIQSPSLDIAVRYPPDSKKVSYYTSLVWSERFLPRPACDPLPS